MTQPAPLFSIRALATGGIGIEELRREIFNAAKLTNIILLRGDRQAPHFPTICPNCEAPATTTLTIERPFIYWIHSNSDTPNSTLPIIDSYKIPFCGNCLNQHQSLQVRPSQLTPIRRIFSDSQGFGGLVVMGVSGLFFKEALIHLRLFPFFLGCFPLLIGFSLIRPVWRKSKYLAIPQPTPVDLAIDFTPSLSLEYEPHWRAFQFRSQLYAAHFREANSSELWNPKCHEANSAAAQRHSESNRSTWIVGAIVLSIIAGLIWYEGPIAFFSGLFD